MKTLKHARNYRGKWAEVWFYPFYSSVPYKKVIGKVLSINQSDSYNESIALLDVTGEVHHAGRGYFVVKGEVPNTELFSYVAHKSVRYIKEMKELRG